MDEYIEREAISEEIRKYYYKNPPNFPMGKVLTVVLIERKEQYSTLPPQMLRQFGMGGGLIKGSMQSAWNAADGVAHNTMA